METKLEGEINEEYFAIPEEGPKERLAWFLELESEVKYSDRPGRKRILDRIARIKERLKSGPPGLQYRGRIPREKKSPDAYWRKRAEKSGDARRAKELAEKLHAQTPLYRSKYAEIVWGEGGEEDWSWEIYSTRYHYPARWRNAGYRMEYPQGDKLPGICIIEDYLGRERYRGPLP